ncbi:MULTISPECIES: N-acetyltransferase [Roseobacteraceae]|uniref:GNAT family N-acetyltransferase n=1 Tax=Roseobacteraceae TaxID=2854170 RepID=UPI0013B6C63A|nr:MULTISPECIES: GNAT family N-acetyltransferase [Roseobacteraceae]MCA0998509.1 GNAT family N-acetyltransferase [Alloyangia pacifica]NDV98778.1 GNAT family N-acetyltransferase [Salipiger sp. PrR002]NDW55515.1 GNAT family N-acetyltransferase [Salipiger sp. PrR004]
MALTLRHNRDRDLAPLAAMLPDAEIPLLNPNAKVPFDEMEWHRKWLGERDDASFYLRDDAGRDVGFFALRVGVGPEVRHLTYAYVAEEARGGAGAELTDLVEQAARDLGALTLTLKVEVDNGPAHNAYLSAGYEELSRRQGMATMWLDLEERLAA